MRVLLTLLSLIAYPPVFAVVAYNYDSLAILIAMAVLGLFVGVANLRLIDAARNMDEDLHLLADYLEAKHGIVEPGPNFSPSLNALLHVREYRRARGQQVPASEWEKSG